MPGAQRRRPAPAAPGPACGAGGSASALRQALGERGAHRRRRREHGELRTAALRLGGILRDDGDDRSFLDERALRVGVLAEGGSTDYEDDVVAGERLAEPGAVGGEVARVERVRLREAGARAEGLLPDRRGEALGERGERGPRLRIVGSGAGDERRRLGLLEQLRELLDRSGVCRGRARTRRSGAAYSCGSGAGACQSSIGTITSAGPRRVCASCQARSSAPGHVLRAHGLVDPDRVLAGEAREPACQERLVGEVAPVLLADGDDERRAVDARGRQRRDRVAEAGCRVQEHERRLSASERIAGRDPDHRALVQREHELEIRGQVDEERHLGRAGVGEDLRHPAPPQDVERGVSDRHRCRSPRRGPIGPHLGAAHVAGEPIPACPRDPRVPRW